jgi:hypothetical protein
VRTSFVSVQSQHFAGGSIIVCSGNSCASTWARGDPIEEDYTVALPTTPMTGDQFEDCLFSVSVAVSVTNTLAELGACAVCAHTRVHEFISADAISISLGVTPVSVASAMSSEAVNDTTVYVQRTVELVPTTFTGASNTEGFIGVADADQPAFAYASANAQTTLFTSPLRVSGFVASRDDVLTGTWPPPAGATATGLEIAFNRNLDATSGLTFDVFDDVARIGFYDTTTNTLYPISIGQIACINDGPLPWVQRLARAADAAVAAAADNTTAGTAVATVALQDEVFGTAIYGDLGSVLFDQLTADVWNSWVNSQFCSVQVQIALA